MRAVRLQGLSVREVRNLRREEVLVAMLCGPHQYDDRDSPLYHRIEGAIDAARIGDFRLLVCGDGNDGRDVRRFVEFAERSGVNASFHYDGDARTIYDIHSILRRLKDDVLYADVCYLILVTDWWHMERACTYFQGERDKFLHPGRPVQVIQYEVMDGPTPTERQFKGELKGIQDYLDGRPYDPYGGPHGKPALTAPPIEPRNFVPTSY